MADLEPVGDSEQPAGPPSRIGRYVVLRALGEGGMGVVYAGYDEELDRKVAVKLLHPTQQGESLLRTRIIREAQALARVSAPNVVHVYEVGEHAGQLFIVMEFVSGTTLAKWQLEDRSWREVIDMYCAAGQGLQQAHEVGLVHRDFKPDNVLIGADGRPRVVDFGLARLSSAESEIPVAPPSPVAEVPIFRASESNPLLTPLTQTGMVMGTPLYMSPEQHRGEGADSRSDQFSFCVALYEAIYNQQPFAGDCLQDLAINTVKGRVQPRPHSSKVPMPIHEALLRGLSTSPDERFPSMRELLAALSYDPRRDRTAAPRVRRLLTMIIPSFVLLLSASRRVLQWLGAGELEASLAVSVSLFVFSTLLPLRFWKVLRTNSFHRGIMVIAFAFTGQLLALRITGMLLGLSLPQIMTLDLASLLGMSCVTSALFLPRTWPIMPLSLVAAVVAAMRPAYAELISSVVVPAGTIATMLQWNRAVQASAQQSKRS